MIANRVNEGVRVIALFSANAQMVNVLVVSAHTTDICTNNPSPFVPHYILPTFQQFFILISAPTNKHKHAATPFPSNPLNPTFWAPGAVLLFLATGCSLYVAIAISQELSRRIFREYSPLLLAIHPNIK